MSDFEAFQFSEAGESYDPAAFERFKERVKKNAKFVAAIRKQEQRQKKREDQLFKILMSFFQKHQKHGILLLASRLLEQNIPAAFILAILILGNEDLRKEVEKVFLPAGDAESLELAELGSPRPTSESAEFQLTQPVVSRAVSLSFGDSFSHFPLIIRGEIEQWGRGLYEAAMFQPFRLLETALLPDGKVKDLVVECLAQVLFEYLQGFSVETSSWNMTIDTARSFCAFLIQGIFQKVRFDLENQKLIAGEEG